MNILNGSYGRSTARIALLSTILAGIFVFIVAGILPAIAAATSKIKTDSINIGLAYVALSESDQVAVINTVTHTAVGIINVSNHGCFFPWRATMHPDSTQVYISCLDSNNVVVIETTGNTVVATLNSLPSADDIAFTRDGAYALVGSRFGNQIGVVDTGSMTVVNTILVSGTTRSLAAHPYLSQIYVTSDSGHILVVDTNTLAVTNIIPVGGEPWDVAVAPNGQLVFATDREGAGLHIIDAAQNTLVTTIPNLGDLTGLAVAPDSSQVYAASLWNGVHIIDIPSLSLLTTVTDVGTAWETAVACDGSELYVGNTSNTLPVIGLASQTVIVQIPLAGSTIRGIAICPEQVTTGPVLQPPSQTNSGGRGEMVSHQLSLVNSTDFTDTYTLTLSNHNWDTSLSIFNTGPVSPNSLVTFTAQVTVPLTADWYSTDTVVIAATSVTSPTIYTTTASVTTEAFAPAQISLSPNSLSSTQFVNELVTQTLTISNGHGVTLTFEIAEVDEAAGLNHRLAYVTMSGSNQVALIDTRTHSAVGSINLGTHGCSFPWRATMSPDGASVYVSCYNSNNVAVIDTATNSVVTLINSLPYADDVAFTRDGNYALVGSRFSNQVGIVDTNSMTVTNTIATTANPRSLATHPTLAIMYVTLSTGQILIIDTNTFTVINTITVGGDPWDVVVAPNGQWVFAGDRWGSGLDVIDTDSNTVLTTITGLGDLTGLAVAPDNTKLYAAGLAGGLHIIDIPSLTLETTVNSIGSAWETAVTCDGSELYVGDISNSIPVINTGSQTLITQVTVPGSEARGIAICPEFVARDVPWLSTNPISGTISTSGSLSVTVSLDATGLQPGTHTADLLVYSNDPLTDTQTVAVTMHVQPTGSMGQVLGTITDAWTDQPLTATVQMVGVYTTTAGTDYSIWAEAGVYTLVAAAPDYFTVTLPITIEAGVTAVHDIALEPNQPRLELETTAIEVSLAPGSTISLDLSLDNTGPAPLIVSLHEINPTLITRAASSTDLTGIHILYDRSHNEASTASYSTLITDATADGATIVENFVYPITEAVLDGYDILWVNCCGYTAWSTNELTAVANWLTQGGAILIHSPNYAAANTLAALYAISYGYGNYTGGPTSYIAEHPVSENVQTVYIPGDYDYLIPGTVRSEIVVLDSNYQQPHLIVHEESGGKMVVVADVDFSDSYINDSDNRLLANNVMHWLATPSYDDLPWLTVTPDSIIIPGHSTGVVSLHFDATTLASSSYEGILALEHNDPQQTWPVQIPVSLDIIGPRFLYLPFITTSN